MNKTILRRRVINEILTPEINQSAPILERIYALRGITRLERNLAALLNYHELSGIDDGVALLEQASQNNWKIVVVGDFDADGATSTALMVLALRRMGFGHVNYLVPNRFEEGYGLSPDVVEQAADLGAQLIITVDNGISSFSGVNAAHQLGIKVLITDHHLPGKQLPDADVIINPNLTNCFFPSKSLAGVGVAFYLMAALRSHFRQTGWFEQQQINAPNMAEFLDLVALGTVADVVPLDENNRILVYQGINRIRHGYCRPGIKALLEVANCNVSQLTATDLGYTLGPRLNAAGRLDNMSIGVELLLCDDIAAVRALAIDLDTLNRTRREIEQGMQTEALTLCDQLEYDSEQLPYGLAIYHPQWHQGVVGILAARIKERYHRPVIAFAPAGDGILKGSGRSVNGLHMRDALERLHSQYPDLLLRFGGHAMAAGLSIKESNFVEFQQRFAELVKEWLGEEHLTDTIWSDGELRQDELSVETALILREGGPWGQGFPEPMFDGHFRILQQRLLKGRHLKLLLEPLNGGPMLDGIAFNVDNRLWPDNSIQKVQLAYQLDINEYKGQRNVQLLIRQLWPL